MMKDGARHSELSATPSLIDHTGWPRPSPLVRGPWLERSSLRANLSDSGREEAYQVYFRNFVGTMQQERWRT